MVSSINSLSHSAKSNGVLFVSANAQIKNIKRKGVKKHSNAFLIVAAISL
jgi:hypothetical protein